VILASFLQALDTTIANVPCHTSAATIGYAGTDHLVLTRMSSPRRSYSTVWLAATAMAQEVLVLSVVVSQ